MKPVAIGLACAGLMAAGAVFAQPRPINHVVAVSRPHHYDGFCPAEIEFIGTIYVNYPTTVSYRWERSDGAAGPVQTTRVNSAGQGVYTRWRLARPPGQVFRGGERLHVLSPGNHLSNPAGFTLVCR